MAENESLARPVASLDIDDMIARSAPSVVEWFSQRLQKEITIDDYHDDFRIMTGISDYDRVYALAEEFRDSGVYRHFGLMPQAKEGMQLLKDAGYELHGNTARVTSLKDDTSFWADSALPGMFDSIQHARIWLEPGEDPVLKQTKFDVVLQLEAVMHADDSVKHANHVALGGIRSYLVGDFEWQCSEELHPDVVHLPHLLAVAETELALVS